MSRRDGEYEKVLEVLDSEVKRWSAKSCEQLISELRGTKTYEVEFESKRYYVDVQLLENTKTYLRVSVAVDDGGFPTCFLPETYSFFCDKPTNNRD